MHRLHDIVVFTHFRKVTDPRRERRRQHLLIDILVIAVCAVVGGANSWIQIAEFGRCKKSWFKRFLELPHGIPSHDTFGRVMSRLNPAEFARCFAEWVQALNIATEGQVIAVDGKTLRGSGDAARDQNPLHVVQAWATENQLMLGQVAVDDKSNEITAIPRLLKLLELKGAVVTIDAMGCQKEIAADIRAQEADYVLAVKDNQPTLREEVRAAFETYAEEDFQAAEVKQQRTVTPGRRDIRTYYVAPVPQTVVDRGEWKDVQSIGLVIRERKETDEVELRFFISSLPPKVRQFAHAIRAHWGIENRLHWSLDVTFAEDKSRIRQGTAPEIAAYLRRFALSLIKQDTSVNKTGLLTKRNAAGWDNDVLWRLITNSAAI